jgi:outer membrane murein-binding lipoprotein Lpp
LFAASADVKNLQKKNKELESTISTLSEKVDILSATVNAMSKRAEKLEAAVKNGNGVMDKIWPPFAAAALAFIFSLVIILSNTKAEHRRVHLQSIKDFLGTLQPDAAPKKTAIFNDLINHKDFVNIHDQYMNLDSVNAMRAKKMQECRDDLDKFISSKFDIDQQQLIDINTVELETFFKYYYANELSYNLKVESVSGYPWKGSVMYPGYIVKGEKDILLFVMQNNKDMADELSDFLMKWTASPEAEDMFNVSRKIDSLKIKISAELDRCRHIVKLTDDCKEFLK